MCRTYEGKCTLLYEGSISGSYRGPTFPHPPGVELSRDALSEPHLPMHSVLAQDRVHSYRAYLSTSQGRRDAGLQSRTTCRMAPVAAPYGTF